MTFNVMRFANVLLFLLWWPGATKCHNTPCKFNSMCMCWVQDDDDYTKWDISCVGVPFARFPGNELKKKKKKRSDSINTLVTSNI